MEWCLVKHRENFTFIIIIIIIIIIIGIWNVRSLCRLGALKSVVGELEKYKLDLVGLQEDS
jgi:hypothetical protein